MTDQLTVPDSTPTPDQIHLPQRCPHCDQHPTANRLDDHITTTHTDLPECTARLDSQHGLYTCAFRVGHKDGKYGDWHASPRGPAGRTIWADWAEGATPHHTEEPQP